MAFPANDLALSLAPRTHTREYIVEPISQIHPPRDSSLPATLLTGHDVIRIFSSRAFAVRTGHLLFNHNRELFPEVEIF